MSRSPWADQSKRSDIRHLRDGSNHKLQTRKCTHTNPIETYCRLYCIHTHSSGGIHTNMNQTEAQAKDEICQQTDMLSCKLSFQNPLSFFCFSHYIIYMSAWTDDWDLEKAFCSMQKLYCHILDDWKSHGFFSRPLMWFLCVLYHFMHGKSSRISFSQMSFLDLQMISMNY